MQTVEVGGLGIGDGYPPRIMGVLNLSEQSPYDPSVFVDPSDAIEHVDTVLVPDGADIVDVGLESANKRFEVLSAQQELDRLEKAIAVKDGVEGDPVFSIETRYHEVADRALHAGFDMVNDICGFADPDLPAVCERHDAAVVKMASPPDLSRPGAVETVDEIYEALRRGGFTSKTIIDPAFGGWSEAKTLAHDRETFQRLREFRALGRPMLVSINRKNFLKDIVDKDTQAALPVSLGATAMAVERGAHIVRTHDVAETRDAALAGAALAPNRVRRDGVEQLDVTTVREARRHIDRITGMNGASRDLAPKSVARAFRIDAPETDRAAIEEVAEAAGDVVVASGQTDRMFLAGTVEGLARMVERLREDTAVERAIPAAIEAAR